MNTLLIGTYTRNTSEGIYRLEFDINTEQFNSLTLVAKTGNPTYLEYHKPSKILTGVYDNEGKAGLGRWHYDHKKGTLIDAVTLDSTPPCYVHYNVSSDRYFDANYHHGHVSVYKDGALEKRITYEAGAKAHYAHTHPKTNDLYTVTLGTDTLHKYKDLELSAEYKAPKGSGPRHLVFHPTVPILYLFTELTCDVIVIKDGDQFEELQVIRSIPKDATPAGAAIRISNDGRFVYVSNRTHDSITVFKVEDDYTLTQIQNISSYGMHPRDFNINPEQTHLMVLNRDSNNLVLYRRNLESGLLTYVSSDTAVPEGVSIIFIEEDE